MPREIDELRRLLGQTSLTKSDVTSLVVQVRKAAESRSSGPQYPTLWRYCNWMVHPALDRKEYYSLLEDLTDAVLRHKDQPPDSAFFQSITDVIGPKHLRSDFLKFCADFAVPDNFCADDSVWKEFFGMLAACLIDTPIRFQDPATMGKNQKAIYDSVTRKAGGRSFAVKGFWLFCKPTGDAHDVGELWWCLDMIPRSTAIPKVMQLTGKLAWPT